MEANRRNTAAGRPRDSPPRTPQHHPLLSAGAANSANAPVRRGVDARGARNGAKGRDDQFPDHRADSLRGGRKGERSASSRVAGAYVGDRSAEAKIRCRFTNGSVGMVAIRNGAKLS